MEHIPDSELIARAKKDPEAFGALYERYVSQIYRYHYYRTGNVQDAEDLTARTFYRALRKLPSYRDWGVPFVAWLYRIAHNLLANWLRDQSRKPVVALDAVATVATPEGGPAAQLETVEEYDWLLQLVRGLPPDRQQLLILKFVEGMSNAQIGAVMGRTEGAVKSLYHRTLVALRARMETERIERREKYGGQG